MGDAATSIRASSRASSGDDTIPFDHERFARMRAHAAFVPTLVLERLAADPRAPAEPYETSFPAAVMFVDIAGYVRLSGATHRSVARRETRLEVQSRASRRKSSGRWRRLASGDAHPDAHVAGLAGEAMRDVVSACFAAIVEIVSLHGGDVVKFAGDALFIAWPAGKDRRADARVRGDDAEETNDEPGDAREAPSSRRRSFSDDVLDETLGETALRAVQCGLAIQASEHAALKQLGLKLVIGTGRARGLHVGGVDDRWEYAVAGEPVTQIARCAPFAAPGEVTVSPECACLEEMRDHAEVLPVQDASERRVDPDVAEDDASDGSDGDATVRAEAAETERRRKPFRFPSARLLFAGALRLGAFSSAADASFAGNADGDASPGVSCRPRTDRGFDAFDPRSPDRLEPLRVARLTNGFDGATVAAAPSPRPSADRDAILREVISSRVARNFDFRSPDPADPAEALVNALERYVPAPARFLGETKRDEARTRRERDVGADRGKPPCCLYDVAWRGEIRLCAVVFLDASLPDLPSARDDDLGDDAGDDADPTRSRGDPMMRRAQTAVATIQGLLKKHGGALRQFLVDDKGSVAIAVFGLPSMSHADDARRAVAFAVEVVAVLEAGGLSGGRAGIATGNAFCGAVGPETRCEYAVYGDCVNVAARLMTKAAPERSDVRADAVTVRSRVLACERTRAACGDAVAFDSGTPVKLKGKRRATRAFAPARRVSAPFGGGTTDENGPRTPDVDRTRPDDGIPSVRPVPSIGSSVSVRVDIDALEPRARGLVVAAAAFSDAFDADRLLAAAGGVAASRIRGASDASRPSARARAPAATREDVRALVRAGTFRRVASVHDASARSGFEAVEGALRDDDASRSGAARAEKAARRDSEEENRRVSSRSSFSDASEEDSRSSSSSSSSSVSRVTVAFSSRASKSDEAWSAKPAAVVAAPRRARRASFGDSLAFASGRVRAAARSMLTDAARRGANRAVAAHLESSLDENTKRALRGASPRAESNVPTLACSSAFLAALAAHWTAAGHRARARRCLSRAGEQELARGTRAGATCAAGFFADALKLCAVPSPTERRERRTEGTTRAGSSGDPAARRRKRLRREAFLARRVGAAWRAAGRGEAAERLVREAIDKFEHAEDAGRPREARACAGVAVFLWCAPRKRGRNAKKNAPRRRVARGTEKSVASSGTSSSSCDSVEADAELASARRALVEITGEAA